MPRFFSNGQESRGTPIAINPSEVTWISVNQLLETTNLSLSGLDAIELTYEGRLLEIGAQLTLTRDLAAGSTDVMFSGVPDYRSERRESVWWMPTGGRAVIALANASPIPIGVTVTDSHNSEEKIMLAPHGTQTVIRYDWPDTFGWTAQPQIGWMTLEAEGPVNSLRTSGFLEDAAGHISGPIRFSDPAAVRQQHLFATNLRPQSTETHLVLRNIANNALTVTPRFLPLAGENGSPVKLAPITVEPSEAVAVDLKPLARAVRNRPDLTQVSVQILSDGEPGDVIGALSVTDRRLGIVYDVPLRDSGSIRFSTGSYPWRLDGDYSTTVSITNVGPLPATFRASINYSGGTYRFKPHALGLGATAIFDLRKIRDEQIPDQNNEVLPTDLEAGQFRWSVWGPDSAVRINGRIELVSASARISSSYSCPVCCPDDFRYARATPANLFLPPQGTGPVGIIGEITTCYGQPVGDVPAYLGGSWWYEEPSVVTGAYMVAEGQANVHTGEEGFSGVGYTWSGGWYWLPGDGDCYGFVTDLVAGPETTVGCPVPVNFELTVGGSVPPPGTLAMGYRWSSITGRLSDLRQCRLGEYVTYNPADIPFPSPPFPGGLNPPNPTITSNILGGSGLATDIHSTPGTFVRPYSERYIVATQTYRYMCPCAGGIWIDILGPHEIVRSVYQNFEGIWRFQISKTGHHAIIDPLP